MGQRCVWGDSGECVVAGVCVGGVSVWGRVCVCGGYVEGGCVGQGAEVCVGGSACGENVCTQYNISIML